MSLRFAFAALCATLAAHALLTLGVLPDPHGVVDLRYLAVEAGAVPPRHARAISVRRDRLGWGMIALGLALWTVGDLVGRCGCNSWKTRRSERRRRLYLGMYVLLYGGLAALLRNRIRPFPAWLGIDGVIVGLTLAAFAAGTVFEPVRAATEASSAVVATTLAYLVADLLLLVFVLVAVAVTRWQAGRSWWLLGGGSWPARSRTRSTSSRSPREPTRTARGWTPCGRSRSSRSPSPPGSALAVPTPPHVGWSMAAVPGISSAASIGVLLPHRDRHTARPDASCSPAPRCSPGSRARC